MDVNVPDEKLEAASEHNETELHTNLNWEELRRRSLQPGGFGKERKIIWPKLLNVKTTSVVSVTGVNEEAPAPEENSNDGKQSFSSQKSAADDDTELKVDHRDEYQIKLDTDRSFVLYPEESETRVPKATLQSQLNDLIVSVFRKRPKLNYFQGYHDITTVLYLTLPFELQQACAEKLSLHRLRDSMLHTLEPVLGLLRVLKNIMRLADPDYAKLLERDSPLPFYALSNLLTLFSHDMPSLPLIQHVFDYLFCRPPIAVVYLAAAVLLSKKQYILDLEGQLEPFMLHPILSSLPLLSEGFGSIPETHRDAEGPSRTEDNSSLSGSDDALKHETEHDSSLAQSRQSKQSTFQSPLPNLGQSMDNVVDSSAIASGAVKQEVLDNLLPADIDNHNNDTSKIPTADSTKRISPDPSLPYFELPTLNSPPATPLSLSRLPDAISEPAPSASGHSVLPPTEPLRLPVILSDADALFAKYPPSHPSLKLSSIMGPQSVVFTWSENVEDLPSDTTAEAMVAHPELVVYPLSPDELEEGASDEADEGSSGTESGSEYGRSEKRARAQSGLRKGKKGVTRKKSGKGKTDRRKKRKTITKKFKRLLSSLGADSSDQQIDRRTMVAGTVMVLGLAMAVYGIKARGSNGDTPGPSGSDSFSAGFHALAHRFREQHRGHLHDELRQVTTVLVGLGARFLNLGRGERPGGGEE